MHARRTIQDVFPDYEPLVELIKIANDPEVDVAVRAGCHKDIAKYLYPQLKAVEHSGHDGGELVIIAKVVPHAD